MVSSERTTQATLTKKNTQVNALLLRMGVVYGVAAAPGP